MKVTRSYLKKIIREELKLAKQQLRESGNWEDLYKSKGEWDIPHPIKRTSFRLPKYSRSTR
jgi:hypothetical protein